MTKKEYKQHLAKQFDSLKEKGDYNIFCHMISDSKMNFADKSISHQEVIQINMNEIIKKGLSLKSEEKYSSYTYGSINGKIKFMGNVSKVNLDSFADYCFFGDNKNTTVAIFAIPKYIKNGNDLVEFSSNNGHTELTSPELQDLRAKFKNRFYVTQTNQCKTTLLDLVITNFTLPPYYLLGFQTKRTKLNNEGKNEQEFNFKENENHISKDEKLVKEHSSAMVQKLKKVFKEHSTDCLSTILIEETANVMGYNDDYLNEP